MKTCEICWDKFAETRANQRYCAACGKDPERARRRYARAEYINKLHAGDLRKVKAVACPECGKKMLTTYGTRFCSIACQEAHRMKIARCPVCRGLLIDKGNASGRGYCSDACRTQARVEKAKAAGHYVPCEECGTMFTRANYSSRFCGKACFEKWRDAQRQQRIETPPPLNPSIARQEERKCAGCGQPFTWRIERSTQRFCTTECRKAADKRDKQNEVDKLALGEKLNICTVCKTSQLDCERFTSNFVYSPEGANGKIVNGKYVIHYCPKFKD